MLFWRDDVECLIITKNATIEPCEGKSVPVLLWTVGKKDELALDRYEGYPTFYEKENISIVQTKKI